MRLSPHFTLAELTRTSHRTIDNSAPAHIVSALRSLCVYLEQVRDEFGPLWITSGYRCPALNAAIGGSRTSAHMLGHAADFVPMARDFHTTDIVRWLAGSGVLFDQVIDEHSSTSSWVHFGICGLGQLPRGQLLTMRGGVYIPFEGFG